MCFRTINKMPQNCSAMYRSAQKKKIDRKEDLKIFFHELHAWIQAIRSDVGRLAHQGLHETLQGI